MKNYSIVPNNKFNSIEVSFTGKPDDNTRAALKALAFRWNPKKSVWYGFSDVETVENAINGVSIEAVATEKASKVRNIASLWERTKVDSIPEHNKRESTREVARQTREHMRERFPELKISCRIGKGGWAAANEVIFEFVSGCYAKDSEAFEAIEEYVKAWLWSFNYDNSDSMTDYFDRNFYEEISAYSYTETEPTEAQKADIANFAEELAKANKEAEERAAEEYAAYMAERERQEKEAEERHAKQEIKKVEICEHVKIVDLAECEQYVISGAMIAPIGKECTTAEVIEDGTEKEESAIISREVRFTNAELYKHFCSMLLFDFDFLAGFGGSTTFDERMDNASIHQLNTEQLESIKWYIANGVAVYLNNVLMLVIDPQGYNYARYTYIVTDYTKRPLAEVENEEKAKSNGEAFHFPAPIAEQAQNIEVGKEYTLIYSDPWTMCATMHHVTITRATVTDYAQHKNSLYIEYIERGKRKAQGCYIYNGGSVLIYRGFLESVPEELTRRHISGNMYEVLNADASVREFLKNVYRHFKNLNHSPIVNTLQF